MKMMSMDKRDLEEKLNQDQKNLIQERLVVAMYNCFE